MNEATNGSFGRPTSSPGVPDLTKLAVDDHADAAGERRGVLEIVGDEQDGDVEAGEQLLQLRADVGFRVGIERRERLVEQQHLRVTGERARERDALALPAGEVARARALEVADREAVEVLVGLVTAAVLDVLADGQVREERVVLEDEPDRVAGPGRARCPRRRRTRPRRRSGCDPTAAARARRPRAGRSSSPRPTARPGPSSRSTSRLSRRLKDRRGTTISSRVSLAMSVRF